MLLCVLCVSVVKLTINPSFFANFANFARNFSFFSGHRDIDFNKKTAAGSVRGLHLSPVEPDSSFGNRQSKPDSSGKPVASFAHPVKGSEEMLYLVFRHSMPMIPDGYGSAGRRYPPVPYGDSLPLRFLPRYSEWHFAPHFPPLAVMIPHCPSRYTLRSKQAAPCDETPWPQNSRHRLFHVSKPRDRWRSHHAMAFRTQTGSASVFDRSTGSAAPTRARYAPGPFPNPRCSSDGTVPAPH